MTLAHRLSGPEGAPVLVLSCSIGTTWELWDAQLPALEPHLRVLRYDHPGHGRSPLPEDDLTVELLSDGVARLLDRLGVERASFCGLSLGGMVGLALARDRPDRVDRLVAACTSAYLGPAEGWHERARIVREAGCGAIAKRVLGRWFTERFLQEEQASVSRFREMLAATPREGYARCCEAIARWDARGTLSAIRASTLVVAGEEDVGTTPADAAELAGSIRGAELAVLPRAAHLPNVEQPALFTQALLAHLAPATAERVG